MDAYSDDEERAQHRTSGAEAPAGDEAQSGNGAAAQEGARDASTAGAGGDEAAAMDPCAYHGIAGEMVEQIGPHTESDPVALLVQILMAFGVLVGRSPYMQVEGDRHYPNLFGLLISETSKGRKGLPTTPQQLRNIIAKFKGPCNLVEKPFSSAPDPE